MKTRIKLWVAALILLAGCAAPRTISYSAVDYTNNCWYGESNKTRKEVLMAIDYLIIASDYNFRFDCENSAKAKADTAFIFTESSILNPASKIK